MNIFKNSASVGAMPILVAMGIALAVASARPSVGAQPNESAAGVIDQTSVNGGGRQNIQRGSRGGMPRSTIEGQVRSLTARLELSEAQQAEVKAILRHRDANAQRIRADASFSALDRGHALYAVDSEATVQIKKLLSPEQLRRASGQAHSAPASPAAGR